MELYPASYWRFRELVLSIDTWSGKPIPRGLRVSIARSMRRMERGLRSEARSELRSRLAEKRRNDRPRFHSFV